MHRKRRIPKVKYSLKIKMIILISLLIIGICIIFSIFLHKFIINVIEDQIGERAIGLAHSVANIPEIKEALQLEDPSLAIQEIVSPIQKESGAEFIVVGNTEGIRYSHPDTSKLGKKMVGGDNDRALFHGESYVSKKNGSLGLSIRGKVPIYSEGKIIGIVSVGFLNDSVQKMIKNQSQTLWFTLGNIMLLGILGASLISYYIKSLLHHMEPEEISRLYLQNEAILQSTHEGIIAVDNQGMITAMNLAAKDILFSKKKQKEINYLGTSIKEITPSLYKSALFKQKDRYYDREMVLGKNIALVNQTPIYSENVFTGVVYTFRKKTELEKMTAELVRIKQYANTQRALTHEYFNKLHIILGLIQNDRKIDAIDFIKKESNMQQNRLNLLKEKVSDPLIHALLQGKFNQANELGIMMTIHPDSHLEYEFSEKKQDAILTALGNVIENAFDAVKTKGESERKVSIFFTDIGDDCIFEIEDAGIGVPQENMSRIFQQGYSTKKGFNRGTGLALTKFALNEAGGAIVLEEGELEGACFVIIIPKD